MREPRIYDEIIKSNEAQAKIGDIWVIAKPVPFYSIRYAISILLERFYHAWLVLIGKAEAIQYAEDSKKVNKKCGLPTRGGIII